MDAEGIVRSLARTVDHARRPWWHQFVNVGMANDVSRWVEGAFGIATNEIGIPRGVHFHMIRKGLEDPPELVNQRVRWAQRVGVLGGTADDSRPCDAPFDDGVSFGPLYAEPGVGH